MKLAGFKSDGIPARYFGARLFPRPFLTRPEGSGVQTMAAVKLIPTGWHFLNHLQKLFAELVLVCRELIRGVIPMDFTVITVTGGHNFDLPFWLLDKLWIVGLWLCHAAPPKFVPHCDWISDLCLLTFWLIKVVTIDSLIPGTHPLLRVCWLSIAYFIGLH